MKIKILATSLFLILSAALLYFKYEILIFLSPLIVVSVIKIFRAEKLDVEELANIKYNPALDRKANRIYLDGEWELSWRGSEKFSIKAPSDLETVEGMGSLSVVRYRKSIRLPVFSRKKVYLCGNGFGGSGTIYVNHEKLAGDIFGYFPYEIEVPDSCMNGEEIEIIFEIDRFKSGLAPGMAEGLAPPYGAGLFRDVYIDIRDSIWFSGAYLREHEGELRAEIKMEGGCGDFPIAVTVNIESIDSKESIFSGNQVTPGFEGNVTVCFKLPKECIKEWSCDSPNMYTIAVTAISGELRVTDSFVSGFSKVGFENGNINVNGENVFLKGLMRSEHYSPYGAAVPRWAAKKDVQSVKEIGLNLIHCEGYPPHPDFMKECDLAGVYWTADIPVRWLAEYADERQLEGRIKECVESALQHPSFLFFTMDGDLPDKLRNFKPADRVHLYSGKFNGSEDEGKLGIVKLDVDLYRMDLLDNIIDGVTESKANYVICDYMDTGGGREERRSRELRKAVFDLRLLKTTDENRWGAVVIGRLFTWGFRQGVLSINRSKKSSSDNIREYMKTKEVVEPDFKEYPVQLPLRIVPLIALFALFSLIMFQMSGKLFFTDSKLFVYFQPYMFMCAFGILMMPVSTFSLPLLFEWKRGWLPGIAHKLKYRTMYDLYNRHWLRILIVFFINLYFLYAGIYIVAKMQNEAFAQVIPALFMSMVFDSVLLVFLFYPVEQVMVVLSAALFGGFFLCGHIKPESAAVFEAIRWVPWITIVLIFKKKDLFKRQIYRR